MIVFQMLFHHLFHQMIPSLGNDVLTERQFSVAFELQGVFLHLHVRFWKQNELCRVYVLRTGRTGGLTAAELRLLSTFLAAISTEADLVCCSGGSFHIVQLLDISLLSKHGVQRPASFDEFAIKKLMHKDSNSVFGLFSILQHLVIVLGGSVQMEWTLFTPDLDKVSTSLPSVHMLRKFKGCSLSRSVERISSLYKGTLVIHPLL